MAGVYDKSLPDRAEDNAKEMLEKFAEKAKASGLTHVETIIHHGSPKVALAREIAPSHDGDLIIVGATEFNALEHFLIGSDSENTVRHAKVDVLVVR